MAYLSQGDSNEELVDKMILNGVLKNEVLIKAFRLTDRGDFIHQSQRAQAYFDRPYKNNFIHMSAPHMYATVLENLDLKEGHSFLNIGAGTGYLSCLAACILADNGLSHGIDCNAEVVQHARSCTDVWFQRLIQRRQSGDVDVPKLSTEGVKFVHGNCFNIDIDACSKMCKYDRIYIGAGCDDADKEYFYQLLADDGIMVLPVDNRNVLEKIVRKSRSYFKASTISSVTFSTLIRQQSANNSPASVILPVVLWAPSYSRHKQFSRVFRDAVHALLLASCASVPSINNESSAPKNIASIPCCIIQYIISFTTRDWFIVEPTELQLLATELRVEHELRIEAEQKLLAALEEQNKMQKNKNMLKSILRRLIRRIGSSVSSVQTSGAYALEALHTLRQSSIDDLDFVHISGTLAVAIHNIHSDESDDEITFTDDDIYDDDDDDDDDGDDDDGDENNDGNLQSLAHTDMVDSGVEEDDQTANSLHVTPILSDIVLGESGIINQLTNQTINQ